MNREIFYDLLGLFFIYSLLGWLLETSMAIIKKRQFLNRGFLNGPFCALYGLATVVMELSMQELKGNWFFLFLGCTIIATVMEWFSGHILEKLGYGKWWDYSYKKWNMDGYVCLQYSILWGILGTITTKYLNDFLIRILRFMPGMPRRIVMLILLGILLVDGIGSYGMLLHITKKMPKITAMNVQIDAFTKRLRLRIFQYLEKRLEKAYPNVQAVQIKEREKAEIFAEGCGFYKLAMLFVIGAFLGDIVEMVFCRLTEGVWMSRSSVVWGHFSIVWGLALVLATVFLYNSRDKSESFIFMVGTLLGGAYEYICSIFTEMVFGTIFWDYSEIPFNLGGRINLLFCLFWGIAAVVWIKGIYPKISSWIEKIPIRIGKVICNVVVIFMIVNVLVSGMALARYTERNTETAPQNSVEKLLDESFPNERMEKIYPKARITR